MPTPLQSLAKAINRWEGKWQASPDDRGNWVAMPDGSRRLIGTMRGVTPAAYAAYRGMESHAITVADMQSITAEIAADIGLTKYYRGTGLDTLPWGPTTDSIVDFGWGAGPNQAVKSMQRLVGAVVDGIVGQDTREKYARWVHDLGWQKSTDAVSDMRKAFYRAISTKPGQAKWLPGWLNRAEWYSSRSKEWWPDWSADLPPLPTAVTDPTPLPKVTEPPPVVPPRPESNMDATIGKVTTAATSVGAVGAAVKSFVDGVDWKVVAIMAGAGLLAGGGWLVFQRMQAKHKAETEAGL